jgi:glutaminase
MHCINIGRLNLFKIICLYLSVNVVDYDRKTPLHVASSKGQKEIAQILIEKGASIRATDNAVSTPLHLAIENGELSTVIFLLEKDQT